MDQPLAGPKQKPPTHRRKVIASVAVDERHLTEDQFLSEARESVVA